MLDPQENSAPNPTSNPTSAAGASAPHGAPPPDAPAQAAFAREPAAELSPQLNPALSAAQPGAAPSLRLSGPAWAEYHLLLNEPSLNEPSSAFTRIEREVRAPGGAPVLALLLARWSAERPQHPVASVELSLTLGRDPNARLLRRELEVWAGRLPSLRLKLREDEAAPEVPYRILTWPHAGASTWGAAASTSGGLQELPRVLQCGEIDGSYRVERGPQVLELPVAERVGHEVRQAALAWAVLCGEPPQRARELGAAALGCWLRQPVPRRIAGDLPWREVEREVEREAAARRVS